MSSSSSASSGFERDAPLQTRKRKRRDAVEFGEINEQSTQEDDEPTPALSHAERRRQKKKALSGMKDASSRAAPPSKKRKTGTNSITIDSAAVATTAKRQNSVWVGNLSFKTTAESLKTFFEGVGEITRIHMPTKAGGTEIRGFAYVDFATPDSKVVAITLSEKHLLGRRLLIKDGNDFTGRPTTPADGTQIQSVSSLGLSKYAQKILKAQKQPPAPTLFLGNLGFETTHDSIRELFEAHRPKEKTKPVVGDGQATAQGGEDLDKSGKKKAVWIRKIRMGTFEDSGNCKGWAFVDFATIEDATATLIHPKNHHLNGRNLTVEYASPDAVRRGGGGPRPKKEPSRPVKGGDGKDQISSRRPNDIARSEERHDEPNARSLPSTDGDAPAPALRNIVRRRETAPRTRTKPGAALALAKRESAAIIPSQGQKITF